MKECYLFIFEDDYIIEIPYNKDFKSAILKLANHTGENSELFVKCLSGFNEEDMDGIVELYNHFAYNGINTIYIVQRKIYPKENEQ
jgi:hypothetical protein